MSDDDRPAWAHRLQAERRTRGWGTHIMARRLLAAIGISGPDPKQIKSIARQILDWEKGKHFPRDWADAYVTAFDTTWADLFGDRVHNWASSINEPSIDLEDDVRRRELLQLGAMGVLAGSTSDLVRHSLEHVLDATETNQAEDWNLAYLDHAHSILTSPPTAVHRALILDLAALRQQLTRAPKDRDLKRAAAKLSALSGNVLTRMGSYDEARRWWSTARHMADVSGDVDLSAWVRGIEAAFALYAPRPLRSAVVLADAARDKAGDRPSAGLLCAMGVQAQALATLGRAEEAHRTLEELTDQAERTNDGDGYGWTPDSLAYVGSWVHAYTSSPDDGVDARAQVMQLSESYQNIANARLHEAIAVGRNGGHREALRTASDVIGGMEPAYRTRMIVRTAQRVLEVLPAERRQDDTAQEFKALLEIPAGGGQRSGST
ncbi:hypothetical protein ACGFNU_24320 [Spirillospora sp. NPDC048911]|uniref:hypothetical protein n=1 Tax=Spirillospora sp. NPDC048911 TaxID=3364527 RepID=UPI0037117046